MQVLMINMSANKQCVMSNLLVCLQRMEEQLANRVERFEEQIHAQIGAQVV